MLKYLIVLVFFYTQVTLASEIATSDAKSTSNQTIALDPNSIDVSDPLTFCKPKDEVNFQTKNRTNGFGEVLTTQKFYRDHIVPELKTITSYNFKLADRMIKCVKNQISDCKEEDELLFDDLPGVMRETRIAAALYTFIKSGGQFRRVRKMRVHSDIVKETPFGELTDSEYQEVEARYKNYLSARSSIKKLKGQERKSGIEMLKGFTDDLLRKVSNNLADFPILHFLKGPFEKQGPESESSFAKRLSDDYLTALKQVRTHAEKEYNNVLTISSELSEGVEEKHHQLLRFTPLVQGALYRHPEYCSLIRSSYEMQEFRAEAKSGILTAVSIGTLPFTFVGGLVGRIAFASAVGTSGVEYFEKKSALDMSNQSLFSVVKNSKDSTVVYAWDHSLKSSESKSAKDSLVILGALGAIGPSIRASQNLIKILAKVKK